MFLAVHHYFHDEDLGPDQFIKEDQAMVRSHPLQKYNSLSPSLHEASVAEW